MYFPINFSYETILLIVSCIRMEVEGSKNDAFMCPCVSFGVLNHIYLVSTLSECRENFIGL